MHRALILSFLCALMIPGCSAKKQSPEFERKWQAAKQKSGLDEVQVIDTKRSDLKGNVQRLGAPKPPPTVGGDRKLPITLNQNQVGRHIRRQIVRLHRCQAATEGKSGRALLTLTISTTGRVASVQVEAPAFRGTRMARCLKRGAKRWRFPRFKKGPLRYTYPFIFR